MRPDGSIELLPVSGSDHEVVKGHQQYLSLMLLGVEIPNSSCSRGDHQPRGGDQRESRVSGKAAHKDVPQK